MAVLIWTEEDGELVNRIRSGRSVFLSAEEMRPEAEALDRELDDLLDMAWENHNKIIESNEGNPKIVSFEQVWVLGRMVSEKGVFSHDALRGEARTLLWQALVPKCWYGVRADTSRETHWRELLPSKAKKWRTQPTKEISYRFMEIGFWLQEQPLKDASLVFGGNLTKAQDLYDRRNLRSLELRDAIFQWVNQQTSEVLDELNRPFRGKGGFSIITKALTKRFPASGPGSTLLPQHYEPDELQAIVNEVLDAARDEYFPAKKD